MIIFFQLKVTLGRIRQDKLNADLTIFYSWLDAEISSRNNLCKIHSSSLLARQVYFICSPVLFLPYDVPEIRITFITSCPSFSWVSSSISTFSILFLKLLILSFSSSLFFSTLSSSSSFFSSSSTSLLPRRVYLSRRSLRVCS